MNLAQAGLAGWLSQQAEAQRGELLRVGVVTDGGPQVPWIQTFLQFMAGFPCLAVQQYRLPNACRAAKPPTLAAHLYAASRRRFDPFGERLCGKPPEISHQAIADLGGLRFDVLIWLCAGPPSALELERLSRWGAFSVRSGSGTSVIPFWQELASGAETLTTTVFWHDRSLTEGRAVAEAETVAARGIQITASSKQPLAAAMRMLAALCVEMQMAWPAFQSRVEALPLVHLNTDAELRYPSNFATASFLARKFARSSYLRWTTRGKETHWFVAIRPNHGGAIINRAEVDTRNFREIPLPRDVVRMADPFLVEHAGRQHLLFEEVAHGERRGRLGSLELFGDGSCSETQIILDKPYHLSYPCVVKQGRDLYMIPESSEAGRVDVYRFSRFPGKLELVGTPIEGAALVDTTPIFIDGHWYFFTTTTEPFMETFLFTAERLEGPWRLHPGNPVSRSVRNSRSAGHLFWRDGRLFRPTQDCSVRYGYAIVVNEVTRLTLSEFEERPVSYVPPTWAPKLLGTHTWNESSAFQTIDGIRFV